jgi:uncharacterized protein YhaN
MSVADSWASMNDARIESELRAERDEQLARIAWTGGTPRWGKYGLSVGVRAADRRVQVHGVGCAFRRLAQEQKGGTAMSDTDFAKDGGPAARHNANEQRERAERAEARVSELEARLREREDRDREVAGEIRQWLGQSNVANFEYDFLDALADQLSSGEGE